MAMKRSTEKEKSDAGDDHLCSRGDEVIMLE
jgi:hypothetical protein